MKTCDWSYSHFNLANDFAALSSTAFLALSQIYSNNSCIFDK